MAAEHVVVVVAQAEGGGQGVGQRPVVLGEQRPHAVLLLRVATVAGTVHAEHAVDHVGVVVLATHGQLVRAEVEVEHGVEHVAFQFHGAQRARQEGLQACHFAGVEGGQRIATPGRAVVGGAGAAADVIPQCLQVGAFIQGQWQRAAQVAALAVGQRGLPGAEAVTALMGQRQLVALVALVGGVAHARLHHAAGDRAAAVRVGNDRVADAPQAGQAVQPAGLALAVVVLLPRAVLVQPQLVVIVDAEVQAHAGVPVGVGHRLATATEADAALPQAAVGQVGR
ncbi:hypothetical protein G6F22_015423 [Rhizopus arrhizus]|nr:hypothetical protein G6F22_015423 [Rhizopus arrhizus]